MLYPYMLYPYVPYSSMLYPSMLYPNMLYPYMLYPYMLYPSMLYPLCVSLVAVSLDAVSPYAVSLYAVSQHAVSPRLYSFTSQFVGSQANKSQLFSPPPLPALNFPICNICPGRMQNFHTFLRGSHGSEAGPFLEQCGSIVIVSTKNTAGDRER